MACPNCGSWPSKRVRAIDGGDTLPAFRTILLCDACQFMWRVSESGETISTYDALAVSSHQRPRTVDSTDLDR
jgi:hypothetical protein